MRLINGKKVRLAVATLLVVFLYSAFISPVKASSISIMVDIDGDFENTCTFDAPSQKYYNCTLRSAILLANEDPGNNTITLKINGLNLTAPLPPITDNLAIKTVGSAITVISGQNAHRIFTIAEGINVSLDHIYLDNGYAEEGGAVYNEGELKINNSWIMRNSAKRGGAIFNKGILLLSDSYITANSAIEKGGAIYSDGGEVFVYQKNTGGKAFDTNTSDKIGAAIYMTNRAFLKVNNMKFYRNVSDVGGAIFLDGEETKAEIYDSLFIKNNVPHIIDLTVTDSHGGAAIHAIHDAELYIENSVFQENQSLSGGGGAIALGDAKATIVGSEFFDNRTTLSDSDVQNDRPFGGAIKAEIHREEDTFSLTIRETLFEGNQAFAGGAIFAAGENTNTNGAPHVDISNSTFSENSTKDSDKNIVMGGGALHLSETMLNVTDSTFLDNLSLTGCGAVGHFGGGLYMYRTEFRNNKAVNAGGALCTKLGSGKIQNSTFNSNSAGYNDSGLLRSYGGAIHISRGQGMGLLEISDTVFTLNKALYGGAIFNRADLNIFSTGLNQQTRFEKNFAGEGGAIFSERFTEPAMVTITDVDFLKNKASRGAALYNIGSVMEMDDILFEENSGYFNGENTIADPSFGWTYNLGAYGIVLYSVGDTSEVTMKHTILKNNKSKMKRSLLRNSLGSLTIEDMYIETPYLDSELENLNGKVSPFLISKGGTVSISSMYGTTLPMGIYVDDNAKLFVDDVYLKNLYGPAIVANYSEATIENSMLTNIRSMVDGYAYAKSAVYVSGQANIDTLTIEHSDTHGVTLAGLVGQTIASSVDNLVVHNTRGRALILQNTPYDILVNSLLTVDVADSQLYNNAYGANISGAVHAQFKNVSINNNSFLNFGIADVSQIGDFSENGVGMRVTDGSQVSIKNSSITNNLSLSETAGLYTRWVKSDTHPTPLTRVHIVNSTIADNNSGYQGENDGKNAGIYNSNAGVYLFSSTVLRNHTISDTEASIKTSMYGDSLPEDRGTYMKNSVVANAKPMLNCIGEPIHSFGYNMSSDDSCFMFQPETSATDQTNTHPNFGLLQLGTNQTFAAYPLDNSPAIDAGSCTYIDYDMTEKNLDSDQHGTLRPNDYYENGDSMCDIGAIEMYL